MTRLADLVATSNRIAAASSRLTKIRELGECLRTLERDEVRIGVLYLAGETPQGRIGLGPSVLFRAATTPPADEPSLTLVDVDRQLSEIAGMRGAGCAQKRSAALSGLFARTTAAERDFLLRLLLGELRQGALSGVMLDAIAAASGVAITQVRRAAMYAKDLGAVAEAVFAGGDAALAQFGLQVLQPIAPMLAQTATDVAEALGALNAEVLFEWKMDGARIQVHKQGHEVRIYTRSLNDVTAALPEIVEAIRALPAQTLILDGEAIAMNAAGRPHPFQITMRRFGRKLDVEALRTELPMQACYFDCLQRDDERLADRPGRERLSALVDVVPSSQQMPRLITRDAAQAQAFYAAALAAGHEGLMAKSLDAPYEAGARGSSWLKIKRAHTLDLVVLAAEWGHGRRHGFLSNLHLGAWDPGAGTFVMLGKTFKGLTDAMLKEQTQALLVRQTHTDGHTVHVRPELVVEVAFSDLQASPRYPGGLALRLARVKRYRYDKRPDEADDLLAVRRIFAAQSSSSAV